MTVTDRWTTKDIARELGLASRANARQVIKRWRARGVGLDVVIDPLTSERLYLPDEIRAASEAGEANPGRGARTDLQRRGGATETEEKS